MKSLNIFKLILLLISINAFGQSLKVGEEVIKKYESPHPYSVSATNSIIWTQNIRYDGATYIALHFSKFQLAKSDFLLIKSMNTEQSWKYYDKGNYNNKNANDGFWSVPIYGDELVIEIHSENSKSDYGYTIDKFARGYTEREMGYKSICGDDDSLEAKCYQSSEHNVYNKSRAVARLLINGTGACTGWLVGDEGHIMTNNHCVGSSSDANNVTVEFMAEGSSCSTNCKSWFACGGTIEASSTALVQTDSNLDYSLLSLPSNVSGTYGYLQLRKLGASLGERIYIPQHPKGWGKRITLASDHSSDSSDGFAHIQSVSEPRGGGTGIDLGYYGDTQNGSSGSPVLGYSDNLVIGLHHWGGCLNLGVPIEEVINDLGSNLPNNSIGCIDNLTITANVNRGSTDIQEASNSITATNVVFNSATAEYNAGNSVLLKTDFHARNGSSFRVYIDGCASKNSEIKENTEPEIIVVYEKIQIKDNTLLEDKEIIKAFPNPVKNLLTIKSKEQISSWSLNDYLGKQINISKSNRKNFIKDRISVSKLNSGLYILTINLANGKVIYKNIIKN